jgi:hypothetical protein
MQSLPVGYGKVNAIRHIAARRVMGRLPRIRALRRIFSMKMQ